MSWHWGRAWEGHAVEDNCPCPKAPCGLVDGLWPGKDWPECVQHNPRNILASKTMRQSHSAGDCPALRKDVEPMVEVVNRLLFRYYNQEDYGVREFTDDLIAELATRREN